MTEAERALVAWAANEIRDLDELCRSMMPGYEPLESADMHKLNALEELADGAELDERDYESEIEDLKDEISQLEAYIDEIRYAVG